MRQKKGTDKPAVIIRTLDDFLNTAAALEYAVDGERTESDFIVHQLLRAIQKGDENADDIVLLIGDLAISFQELMRPIQYRYSKIVEKRSKQTS